MNMPLLRIQGPAPQFLIEAASILIQLLHLHSEALGCEALGRDRGCEALGCEALLRRSLVAFLRLLREGRKDTENNDRQGAHSDSTPRSTGSGPMLEDHLQPLFQTVNRSHCAGSGRQVVITRHVERLDDGLRVGNGPIREKTEHRVVAAGLLCLAQTSTCPGRQLRGSLGSMAYRARNLRLQLVVQRPGGDHFQSDLARCAG